MVENENVIIIDASTAHRTEQSWCYGFPELSEDLRSKLLSSKRIAVPGCHASGFIALVYPLVESGIISRDTLLTCHSLTGYSGGGKKMIADYEDDTRAYTYGAPRQYALAQKHKHLPEMAKITGLEKPPVFSPIVADFYSGMEVTVPFFKEFLQFGCIEDIKEIYRQRYHTPLVSYVEDDENGFLSAAKLSGKDNMQIQVCGNDDRMILVARYDNLGKGASGAAIECFNVKLGCEKTKTLVL
jgi:N-acetyl-gamma-glutamyl-phosphate reductase